MKRVVIFAIVFMALVTSCTRRSHTPTVIDSSLEDDPIIETNFRWSTGDSVPWITFDKPGIYDREATYVYASGDTLKCCITFITTNKIEIDQDPSKVVFKIVYWDPTDPKFVHSY